jgi:Flp pilus assembly protein TadG
MSRLRGFWRDERGAGAAEFVLLTPILLVFLFGVLDTGWYAWNLALAEKAVQAGARVAVVTAPVASGLASEGYVGKTIGGVKLTQGDVIPAAALALLSCTSTACTCSDASACVASTARSADAFNLIAGRMKAMNPMITNANITIEYRGSGLGYAGDPLGMEIAPMTTVRVSGLTYRPLMGLVMATGIGMPTASHTLTMEDAQGTFSN